jgi:short-subunit dehydrogenase
MVKVHALAPVKLINAVLPGMRNAGRGIIINVCSLAARTVGPGLSTYNATKAFLQVFSEALHTEHMDDGIIIQALCPGFTHTDFHEKIGWSKSIQVNRGILLWMSPERVVEYSLAHLKKNRVICIPGFWNRVIWRLMAVIPRPLLYRISAGVKDFSDSRK